MEKQLKLKLLMVQSHAITVFTRREVKPAQTALLQSLLGPEDLHTGTSPTYFMSLALGIIC
jgi:hypothetical protein